MERKDKTMKEPANIQIIVIPGQENRVSSRDKMVQEAIQKISLSWLSNQRAQQVLSTVGENTPHWDMMCIPNRKWNWTLPPVGAGGDGPVMAPATFIYLGFTLIPVSLLFLKLYHWFHVVSVNLGTFQNDGVLLSFYKDLCLWTWARTSRDVTWGRLAFAGGRGTAPTSLRMQILSFQATGHLMSRHHGHSMWV